MGTPAGQTYEIPLLGYWDLIFSYNPGGWDGTTFPVPVAILRDIFSLIWGSASPDSPPVPTIFFEDNAGLDRNAMRAGWFSFPIIPIPDDGGPDQLVIGNAGGIIVGGDLDTLWVGPFTLQQVAALFSGYQTGTIVSTIGSGFTTPELPILGQASGTDVYFAKNWEAQGLSLTWTSEDGLTGVNLYLGVLGNILSGKTGEDAGVIIGMIYWKKGYYLNCQANIAQANVGGESFIYAFSAIGDTASLSPSTTFDLFGGKDAGGVSIPLYFQTTDHTPSGNVALQLTKPVDLSLP